MTHARHRLAERLSTIVVLALSAVAGGSCAQHSDREKPDSSAAVLRVGVAQLFLANPSQGLRQLTQILAVESLARPGEDGRMQPLLAEGWTPIRGGRALTVKLRPHVKFHDGSALDPATVASVLAGSMHSFMGPVFDDVDYVKASGADSIEVGFKEASPLLLEALEAGVQKPGTTAVGTGPFMVSQNTAELRANADYYQGQPAIAHITVSNYPNARAAWAELLRDRLDMLWEVGVDALDSMKHSSTATVFTFTRRYQHVIVFNTQAPALRSPKIRRALNLAVDRASVVRGALNDYGVASSGPIWPHYWALPRESPQFGFDPKRAAELLGGANRKTAVHFTCLVSSDSVDERIALEVKRQLAAVGVDMAVEEASRDEIVRRAGKGEYEALVTEPISGPTLFRPYLIWHSNSPVNWGHFGNQTIDTALDRVRHAPSEADYRQAVAGLQQAFMDDPPAIFLAWSVRARAVSRRFVVPPAEPGRDVLSTLRVWKPTSTGQQQASRN